MKRENKTLLVECLSFETPLIKLYMVIIGMFQHTHSVLTICTQSGTCNTRSGDLVFFSAAFDKFSVFT